MDIVVPCCPYCKKKYDLGDHLPYVVHCHFTICTSCLIDFIAGDSSLRCPKDNAVFEIPLNFEEELESRPDLALKVQRIDRRQEIMTQANTDQLYNNFQKDVETKAKFLQDSLNNLLDYEEHLQSFITQKRDIFMKMTKERFDALKEFLNSVEADSISKINSFFDEVIEDLRRRAGASSMLVTNIQEKISSLSSAQELTDLLDVMEEDISSIIVHTDLKKLKRSCKTAKTEIENGLNLFENSLVKLGNSIFQIKFDGEELTQRTLQKFIGKGNQEIMTPGKSSVMKNIRENILMISAKRPGEESDSGDDSAAAEDSNTNTEEWRKKHMVRFNVSKEMMKRGNIIEMMSIWNNLDQKTSLSINFADKKISDTELTELGPFLLWDIRNLHEINISFNYCKSLSNLQMKSFISKMVPQISCMKKLYLDLGATIVSDAYLPLFACENSSHLNSLETLDLNLANTKIGDGDLFHLFDGLKNLKKLVLDFTNTDITDLGLQRFVDRSVPSMPTLEHLEMNLSYTNVTDVSITGLMKVLLNLKTLNLSLKNTQVTDHVIQAFCDNTWLHYTLETFDILTENTFVTNREDLGQIKAQIAAKNSDDIRAN